MASRPSLTEDDFSCPVCCDIYKEPILLACSHSICKGCLQTFWQQHETLECPICRTVSSTADPPVNIVLHNMCQAVLKERTRRMSVEMEGLCSIHHKALMHFCVKDQRPICNTCRDSKLHRSHTVCSTQEASQDLKKQLLMKLNPLQEKMKTYKDFEKSCVQTEQHIKKQSQHTETVIKREFEKLHQFLWDEEAARLAALKEEEAERCQALKKKMEKTAIQISCVSETLKAIEKAMEEEDMSFLLKYNSLVERAQAKLENPDKLSGVLINVAKHLHNLGFKVSEKMHGLVKYYPVALDPNTAHAGLLVSDDLMTLVNKGEHQQVPNNTERFEGYVSVLGSESFNSGNHCWDVEVGDNSAWAVGVISQSVYEQRENLSRFGLWYVGFCNGNYGKGYAPEILTALHVNKRILKIRVQLDFKKGKVIFTDLDRNTCLHMFKQTFNEKVFPYFYSYDQQHPLKVLPAKSSVTIQI